MAIDFGGLATTDNYSTAYTPKINEAVKALAYMLDPAYASYTGTPFTNAKRFNGGALEKFNGSSWVAQPLAGPHNGTVGATTPSTGAFTTLSASGAASVGAGLAVTGALSATGSISAGNDLQISGNGLALQAASGASTIEFNYTGKSVPFNWRNGSGGLWMALSSTGLSVTGNIIAAAPGQGYAVMVPGSGGASGYIGFYSSGALRQGFIGAMTTNNATDTGTVPYVAGTHAFSGAMTVSNTLAVTSNVTAPNYILGTTASSGSFTTDPSATVAISMYGSTNGTPNLIKFITGSTEVGRFSASAFITQRAAYTSPQTTSFSATPSFNASLGNFFTMGAMTANVTSVTITNGQEGQFLTIRFTQDATGGRTITTGNMGATNAPSISGSPSTAANKASYLNLTYNATAARWEGSWLGTT